MYDSIMSTTRIDSGWIVSTRATVALEPIFMINESMLVPSRPIPTKLYRFVTTQKSSNASLVVDEI